MRQVTSEDDETGSGTASAQPHDDPRDRAATHRLCALTRQERPTSELLRFVAGPDDRIYFDLSRKLPGRGVWVTADRESVATASKSGTFARSLKRKVTVPAELAEKVETQLVDRVCQSLSLANKAGLVVTGFDKVFAVIERWEASVLLHGIDAAPGGRDKLDSKLRAICRAGDGLATIVDCLTIDQLSLAIGRPNVVHAALKAGGATERFAESAALLTRYRLGMGAGGAIGSDAKTGGDPAPTGVPGGEAAS